MNTDQNPHTKKPEVDFVIDENGTDKKDSPAKQPSRPIKINGEPRWRRFTDWYKENKKKSLPLTLLVVVILLAAIPWTRYKAASLALKNNLTVKVIDSTTGTPVSGADLTLGSVKAVTDGSGKAILPKTKVGTHALLISKKYYKGTSTNVLVPILRQRGTANIHLVATGRQVKVLVKDLINHSALGNVDIKVAGANAKTDKSGTAIVVLPVGTKSEKGTLSLDGYNNAAVTVKANDQTIQENSYTLTPSGKIYFLSKLSGKIDVVKTNLDGSGRQTVLAGTGKEDDRGTVLLASRDWKYLALLSRRETGATKLYLLDTSSDALKTVDGDANTTVTLAGWSDHNFIYSINRQKVESWQPNKQALKSYNANNGKITLLAQTTASGSNTYDYIGQSLGEVYAYNDQVVYGMNWVAGYNSWSQLNSKQATLNSIKPDGTNNKAIKSFSVSADSQTSGVSISTKAYKPGGLYILFSDGSAAHYYNYDYETGQVKDDSNLTDDKFWSTSFPTYLESPDTKAVFWNEPRDGKNTLFVGNEDGENGKQVATLSDYQTYGWYTDNYLLVSRNSSELYIIPRSGLSKDSSAIKISDYHKPAQSFPGYGGGYGGI
jgi:hypothetical protein